MDMDSVAGRKTDKHPELSDEDSCRVKKKKKPRAQEQGELS